MFDRIFDAVYEFIDLFRFWEIINEFEKGVVLRFGKYHRTINPGFNLIIPFAIEDVLTTNIKPEPLYLDVQSLHTEDCYTCNIQVGIVWRVVDIKEFLIENEDPDTIIAMLCSGVVTDTVHHSPWNDIRQKGFAKSMRAAMNRKARKRGAEIDEVVIQDLSNGEANRYWHEGISIQV